MNVNLLIDNIVRQTTVLIAQLATAAGGRAPLSHVAGQVFLDLVSELKRQGVGSKVIADMFGLALRTYHDRVRRQVESVTDRGVSLWEAVLSYVREHNTVSRAQLLRRFHADDEPSVRGVLNDLVGSGLLFKSGRGHSTVYRAAKPDELAPQTTDVEASRAQVAWVALHQQALTAAELAQLLTLSDEATRAALATLTSEHRVALDAETGRYRADQIVIPYGAENGWEAALFDHYQAVVAAIAGKVSRGQRRAEHDEATGGSTYHFDLHRGHPLEDETLGFLKRVRDQASKLRREIEEHPSGSADDTYRVVFYAGQNVIDAESLAPSSRNEDDE